MLITGTRTRQLLLRCIGESSSSSSSSLRYLKQHTHVKRKLTDGGDVVIIRIKKYYICRTTWSFFFSINLSILIHSRAVVYVRLLYSTSCASFRCGVATPYTNSFCPSFSVWFLFFIFLLFIV